MNIRNKVTIITGASAGIGLATAKLFDQHGAKLVLVARSAESLQRQAAEFQDAMAIPTDLRDTAAVRRMVQEAHEHFGRIDVLINNAGQGLYAPVEQIDLHQYRELLELNVVAVLAAMQAVIPILRAQGGGVIVNISSGLSKLYVPGMAGYASTKYALNAITLTARAELANDNIRVGLVVPGRTATDFWRKAIHNVGGLADIPNPGMPMDTPEIVAAKILEAAQTEAAETYVSEAMRL